MLARHYIRNVWSLTPIIFLFEYFHAQNFEFED